MILLLVLLFSNGLFFHTQSAEPNKRASSTDFDFYNHRQKFMSTVTIDGVLQGIAPKDMKSPMRSDHLYETLHAAAAADDAKGIELLLGLPKHRRFLDGFDATGQTPLQVAVDCGCSNAIEALIKNGADVYAYDQDGNYTALSLAHAYFTATIYTNVVPLLKMKELLGDSLTISFKKNKKVKKESAISSEQKPTKKIILRRRRNRCITPEPHADKSPEYDPYLLNV